MRDKLQGGSIVLLCGGVGWACGGGGGAGRPGIRTDVRLRGLSLPPLLTQRLLPGTWALGEGAPSPACLILSGEPRKTGKVREARLACSVPGSALRALPPPCSRTELDSGQSPGVFHPQGQPCGRGRADAVVLCCGQGDQSPLHEEYEGSERQQQAAVLRNPGTAISAGGGNTWPVLRDPLGFQWSGRG